jgi:hypothetical protein
MEETEDTITMEDTYIPYWSRPRAYGRRLTASRGGMLRRTWRIYGDAEGAKRQFARWPNADAAVAGGDWGVEDSSVAVTVSARCVETDEDFGELIIIDPDESECTVGDEHAWRGDKHVYSHGAGISSGSTCMLCGLRLEHYTCTQGANASTEHDHDGVRYEEGTMTVGELAEYHSGEIPTAALEALDGSDRARELVGACLAYRVDHEPDRGLSEAEQTAIEEHLLHSWRIPSRDRVAATYVANCFGDDGCQPGTIEVCIEVATLGRVELWRWAEDESSEHGEVRLIRDQAVADAAEVAANKDETPDLDETIAAIVETGFFRTDADDVRAVCEVAVSYSEGYLLLIPGNILPSPAGIAWTTNGYLQCDHVQLACGQDSVELAAAALLHICLSTH